MNTAKANTARNSKKSLGNKEIVALLDQTLVFSDIESLKMFLKNLFLSKSIISFIDPKVSANVCDIIMSDSSLFNPHIF